MAAKARPYETFGPYVLLKKLESDALGDLFRAVRIEDGAPGRVVALRRFSGGSEALLAAAQSAEQIAESLTGPTFVKEQQITVINGVVTIAHEYESGRSLRYIVDRARGTGSAPHPIPLDQTIAVVERVALSLAATAELRLGAERLLHGGLVPQFVWITEDGEIRVAGQQLGRGLAASLRDEKVAVEIGRYFAPETQHSGQASRSSEVYSLGALLYLLVTGHEPPDATRASAFTHAVRAARSMAGDPLPDDIRSILEKSLNIDPAARYASPSDMHTALAALSSSGRYAATSFNLAFYLSTLLKKEMEVEAGERERESKISLAPYLQAEAQPVAAEKPAAGKSRLAVGIAAATVLAAAGVGAWLTLGAKRPAPAVPVVHVAGAMTPPAPQPQPVVAPEPIVASPTVEEPEASSAPAAQPKIDEAERKRLFDAAVKRRLQEELLKLQAEYTQQLRREQARNAPLTSTVASQPAVVQTEQEPAAAMPQREEEITTTVAQRPLTSETQIAALEPLANPATAAPPPVLTQTQPQSQPPPQPPPAPVIREGDVVDMGELDEVPTAIREPRPSYPPIAARQKMEATVMASILVSETGEVVEVKILRGEPRFGFNDSAIRAFRAARYTPPMKDGKRVKTWIAQMIQFKP